MRPLSISGQLSTRWPALNQKQPSKVEMAVLGIRIVLALPGEAEYAEDYEILWAYEGPNAIDVFQQKVENWIDLEDEYIVQLKYKDGWKTYEF